jgi:hypothetical protein
LPQLQQASDSAIEKESILSPPPQKKKKILNP